MTQTPDRHTPTGKLACSAEAHPDRPARWLPVLKVWADRAFHGAHPPMEAIIGLSVCDECRHATKLGDILNDDAWAQIERMTTAVGKAIPDRKTAQLSWIRLDSAKARAFNRRRTQRPNPGHQA